MFVTTLTSESNFGEQIFLAFYINFCAGELVKSLINEMKLFSFAKVVRNSNH